MNFPKQPQNSSIALLLIIGVLAVSTSSILIRLANMEAGAGEPRFQSDTRRFSLEFVFLNSASGLAENSVELFATGSSALCCGGWFVSRPALCSLDYLTFLYFDCGFDSPRHHNSGLDSAVVALLVWRKTHQNVDRWHYYSPCRGNGDRSGECGRRKCR